MNANDATLTELATAQSGSMVEDKASNAPASGSFDLVVEAVAGSAVGNSGAPYTLTISAIDLTAVNQGSPMQAGSSTKSAIWQQTGWKSDHAQSLDLAPRCMRRSALALLVADRCDD
jgi:hypothetical protein